jgi:uncharacterized membrane protein
MNTIVMSMRYARMSDTYEMTLEFLNYSFSLVFNIEMVLKLIGMGKHYFSSSWNKFDFLIVLGTDIGFLLNLMSIGIDISTAATVIRAFRIMRVARLMKSFGRVILDTLAYIIPQITNIMSLIFLLLFIYSALGINLFSTIMYRENYNELNNFRNFYNSIIILMRCATGEDWHLIMDDLASTSSYNDQECEDDQTWKEMQDDGIRGCGSSFSMPYFLTFILVISFVAMNLSVAAVIDGLRSARKDDCAIISVDCIERMIDIWSEYDPNATGWISVESLVFLIFESPKPLGLGSEMPSDISISDMALENMKNLSILEARIYNNEI